MSRFTAEGLLLEDGSTVPVYAGELHYWRLDRQSWKPCLLAMRDMGLTMVSTVVPWSVHELSPGRFDFTGNLDLPAFLAMAQKLGLHAIVRPGPHVNAQLTHFGFPERILANPVMQARSSRGTRVWLPVPPKMFPVPSYASSEFQSEVSSWLAGLGKVLTPLLPPKGPVVAIQIDHEMQMFWRSSAFEADYHPEALLWWEDFSGGQDAPRHAKPGEMPLQWVAFQEEYLRRSMRWLCQAVTRAGLGELARYHNLPPSPPSLCQLAAVEESVDGVCAMDFYARALSQDTHGASYSKLRERALYLRGSATLAFAAELGLGAPPWFPPPTMAQEQNLLLGALAGGIRAFNLCMAVQRERWAGGAIDEQGRLDPEAEWLPLLLEGLHEMEFHRLERAAPIAVIVSHAEARAAVASSVLHSASPVVTDLMGLGPSGHAELSTDESARLYPRWLAAIQRALDLGELPYQLIDEGCMHRVGPNTKAVIMPTLRRVNGAAWAALHALAGAGMQVVLGPSLPQEDELGRALGDDSLRPPGGGMLDAGLVADLEELSAALLGLAGDLEDEWIAPEAEEVDCTLYVDAKGQPKAFFVGNRAERCCEAMVNLPPGCQLRDLLSKEVITEEAGTALISLQVQQVRLFAVQRFPLAPTTKERYP